jgi:hypothetical protein
MCGASVRGGGSVVEAWLNLLMANAELDPSDTQLDLRCMLSIFHNSPSIHPIVGPAMVYYA